MKNPLKILAIGILTLFIVFGTLVAFGADIPPQAQASTLAVPDPSPVYTAAILVVQCRDVAAMIRIDDHGNLHPYRGPGSSLRELLDLLAGVPADNVLQVTLPCPTDVST